jgi:hypothetical protein
MVSALATLPLLRQHLDVEGDLLAVVVNARSRVEATLALGILRETLSEKVLMAALNLREVLHSLPDYPCSMAVDEATLARVRSAWRVQLDDDSEVALNVTTAGNFCFDLVLEVDGTTYFWTPSTAEEDIINPGLLPLLLDRAAILPAVIALTRDMGLVFNPRFYMSLDDWNLDHLQESFADFEALF